MSNVELAPASKDWYVFEFQQLIDAKSSALFLKPICLDKPKKASWMLTAGGLVSGVHPSRRTRRAGAAFDRNPVVSCLGEGENLCVKNMVSKHLEGPGRHQVTAKKAVMSLVKSQRCTL